MNYTIIKKLPSAEEVIQSLPLSMEWHQKVIKGQILACLNKLKNY